jgi:hypothetical protein
VLVALTVGMLAQGWAAKTGPEMVALAPQHPRPTHQAPPAPPYATPAAPRWKVEEVVFRPGPAGVTASSALWTRAQTRPTDLQAGPIADAGAVPKALARSRPRWLPVGMGGIAIVTLMIVVAWHSAWFADRAALPRVQGQGYGCAADRPRTWRALRPRGQCAPDYNSIVRGNVQLISAGIGAQLWAESACSTLRRHEPCASAQPIPMHST